MQFTFYRAFDCVKGSIFNIEAIGGIVSGYHIELGQKILLLLGIIVIRVVKKGLRNCYLPGGGNTGIAILCVGI